MLKIILAIVPGILLYFPFLYYVSSIPYAFSHDLYDVSSIDILDSWDSFYGYIFSMLTPTASGRFRPFHDLYNAVMWKAFGLTLWLHVTARFILYFGAIYASTAAFLCLFLQSGIMNNQSRKIGIRICSAAHLTLPIVVLIGIWLFFPNNPAVRPGPQEVYTVFFLSVCNYMIACALVRDGERRTTFKDYCIFCLSFSGLCWSKEVNIAPALCIGLFYGTLLLRQGQVLRSVPLALVFSWTLLKVYLASTITGIGYEQTTTADMFIQNSVNLFQHLFLLETSYQITSVFLIFIVLSLSYAVVKIAKKRRLDRQSSFVFLLLGEGGSMYLMLCCTWNATNALRYWYPLIPILTMLFAIGSKFFLDVARGYSKAFIYASTLFQISFVLYFVSINYYNFLWQAAVYIRTYQIDKSFILEVDRLASEGHCVQVERKGEFRVEMLLNYFHEFRPRYYEDKGYEVRDGRSPDEVQKLTYSSPLRRSVPPCQPDRPYQVVEYQDLPDLDVHAVFDDRGNDYKLLSWSSKIARALQQAPPYLRQDAGTFDLSHYRWIIYRKLPKHYAG